MSAKQPIGYVAIDQRAGVPCWTGTGSAKLYLTRASATSAMKNSGRREGTFRVEPVYLGEPA